MSQTPSQTLPENTFVFDARGVSKRFRHAAIFGALESMGDGEVMRFMNDHDPLPLLGQIAHRYQGQVKANYVERGSEGVIIVYGRSAPAWVQAQYVRARKVLAQRRKGVWGALLEGPPRDKPEVGVASRSLMMLDCRDGPQRQHIERFVNTLRGAAHA